MRRLLRLILDSPLRRVLFAAQDAWNRINDWWLNIDTHHANIGQGAGESVTAEELGDKTDAARHADSVEYGSVDFRNIRKALRHLRLQPDDVLLDIGCGKGRVLCVAARQRLKRVVGIELFEGLCLTARRNAAQLRGRKSPIEVISGDASKTDLSAYTVFYLFNPFGAETMRDVLANLWESLQRNPHPIRICYFNPRQEAVFRECGWLKLDHAFRTWGGSRVTFWKNV